MRIAALGVGLASLLLCACDLAPPYRPPPLAVPPAFKEGGLWVHSHPDDEAVRGPWWVAFHDSTLDKLEPQVDDANQSLAAALANYQVARSNVQQAEAGLFPTLDANSQLTTNRQSLHRTYRSLPSTEPNHYGNNQLGISSSYELDLWGRVRDLVKASAAEAQAQAATLENVRLSLHAEVARDYVVLRGLDRELSLLSDTEKAFSQALQLTQERFNGKIASPMDVERARAQLETARALIEDTHAKRAVLEHAIAVLVGKPASDFTIPFAPIAVATPRGPAAAPSTLLERRPDIAAAERQVAVANEQVGVAKTAFFPRFFLNLSGGTQDRGVRLFNLQNEFYSLGPSVSLPLFDGGRRTADLTAALARRDENAALYRQTFLRAVQEVEDALSNERYLIAENRRLEAAVTAEKKVLDLSLTLYRDGATTYLDVVIAQTALLDQQRASLGVLTRRLTTAVNLFVALGGGWSPDVQVATKTAR